MTAKRTPRPRTFLIDIRKISPAFLPFADAASTELPLPRLLRLALFQVSVGMALVLLAGTLNRVMIVEMGVPASLVALMIALPILVAPFRALIGHKSDTHKSFLGWRRVPYVWMGTLLQFGGFAIMPFALLLLSEGGNGPEWTGEVAAMLAFFMVGAGLHTTQTAGLALATDIAPEEKRPQVVALLYVMLLVGMLISAIVFGTLLRDYTPLTLIQCIQGAAVITAVLNIVALWKQEARNPELTAPERPRATFREAWAAFRSDPRSGRLLFAVGLGTAGFSMQDVLLEPYGGEILMLSVSATTALTAILAAGTLVGLFLAARSLQRGFDTHRLAGFGCLIGIFAFAAVIFADPLQSAALFRVGTFLIGLGGGLFSVGMLLSAMSLSSGEGNGLALGAWGAVQATAMGAGILFGGLLRDVMAHLAVAGHLGAALTSPAVGYSAVWHLEILLLFATLVAIGPLVAANSARRRGGQAPLKFGLAELPS